MIKHQIYWNYSKPFKAIINVTLIEILSFQQDLALTSSGHNWKYVCFSVGAVYVLKWLLGLRYIDFSKIDFYDKSWNETNNLIIIRIRNISNGHIFHKHPKLDRCCKSVDTDVDKHLSFSGKDKIDRVSCGINKKEFLRKYVKKRRAVILEGCQDTWPARNWTFEGILRPSKAYGLILILPYVKFFVCDINTLHIME